MSRLEKQHGNSLKYRFVKIILNSNSSYTGHFIECTENGFIGIRTEITKTIEKHMYFPKESIRSIEFTIDNQQYSVDII